MNYLFLDLSTKSSGWAVSDAAGNLVDYGCVQSSSQNIFKRIVIMREGLREVIKKHNIDKIVAEEVYNEGTNSHTQKVLLWLQGIILTTGYEINPKVEYELILPSTWRSKLNFQQGRGVKRDFLKKQEMNYVLEKYQIKANDDVCDAIALKDAYFIKEDANTFSWD